MKLEIGTWCTSDFIFLAILTIVGMVTFPWCVLLCYQLAYFVVANFTPVWQYHWLSSIIPCLKLLQVIRWCLPPPILLLAVSHILQILTFIFDFQFREMFATGTQVFSKLICGHFVPECDDIWRQGPHEADHSWWDLCPYQKRHEKKKPLTFLISLLYKCYREK